MVSRRTRSYKDKRPAGIFGQFMLPIAVIMAIILLYFSVKLFFLNSSEPKRQETSSGRPAVSSEAQGNASAVPAEQPVPDVPPAAPAAPVPSAPPAQPRPAPIVAGPVDGQPSTTAQKPQPPAARPAETKPAAPPKATPPAAPKPAQPTAAKPPAVRRYDIQIGAFSARDNAVQLVHKARAQGYEVYVNEAEKDGPPYRVRVKGTADRQQTEALSAKLKAQGYPIYVVTIN